MLNTDPNTPFHVCRGERIAQLVVMAFSAVCFALTAELPASDRGVEGWGHSGRH
jgi:dUTPase